MPLPAPAALTRRVDGVQSDLPGTDEPAHLLQVPLPDVVLKDDVVGEAHGARCSQSLSIPTVPGHRDGEIVLHAERSLRPLPRKKGAEACGGL